MARRSPSFYEEISDDTLAVYVKRIVRIPIPTFELYASGRAPTQRRVVRRRVAELPPIAPGERVGDLEPV